MTSDNPNVSLGIFDCSLYSRRIALKDDYHKKRMDMLAYTPVEINYTETLAKTFIIPSKQFQFIQENFFNKAPIRGIAIAMNTNSAFTGPCTKNPFWYQQFCLRQKRIFRAGQPILDFDTADNCCIYVTTWKAMNFQEDITSIPIDNFKDHYVLVFDMTSMPDATENCHHLKLFGEPLRLELSFTYLLEHNTELIVLRGRKSSVSVDKFRVFGKKFESNSICLQQILNCIPLLRYRYFGSFPSDYVPIRPNETLALINTQTSDMQGKHWIIIAHSRHKLFFADVLGQRSFLKQQYKQIMPEPLQPQPIVCGFYAIYAPFNLFKSRQGEFAGVHDVNLLSFKTSYL